MKKTHQTDLKTENQLLISMLNKDLGQQQVSSTQTSIRLHRLATLHGIIPQVYKTLQIYGHLLDKTETSKIQKDQQHFLRMNLVLSAHLRTLTQTLDQHNFSYLSIKGATLAQELYHDISMRQFSDIDLFVNEKDIYALSECIVALGYTPVLPLSLLKRKKFLELDNDFSFRHTKTNALLELHWKLFPKRHKMSLPFSELHSRASKLSFQNRSIDTLSPEDNLLYLSLHGAKHIFERYEWVYDLDQLIRTYPLLDLIEVHERAKEIHVDAPFLLGIFLSHTLFDTPIPKAFETHRTAHIQTLIDTTLSYYDQGFVFWDESDKKQARFLFLSELFQNKESKMIWLFKSLFKTTPVDVITFNFPNKLAFLYPILRPFRLLYKHLFTKKPQYDTL